MIISNDNYIKREISIGMPQIMHTYRITRNNICIYRETESYIGIPNWQSPIGLPLCLFPIDCLLDTGIYMFVYIYIYLYTHVYRYLHTTVGF